VLKVSFLRGDICRAGWVAFTVPGIDRFFDTSPLNIVEKSVKEGTSGYLGLDWRPEEAVKPSSNNDASTGATPTPSPSLVGESAPSPKPTPTPTPFKLGLEAAQADLANAWKSLTSQRRAQLGQEEQKWIKHASSLSEEERIESTKKRADYLWSLVERSLDD
jgi:hypothetical protein